MENSHDFLQHADIQVMEEVPVREISHANRREVSPARTWGVAHGPALLYVQEYSQNHPGTNHESTH